MKEKKYEEILEEINKCVKTNLKELKEPINNYIVNISLEIDKLLFEAKNIINNFIEKDYYLQDFKSYFIENVGDENKIDLTEEIYLEIINSSENLFYILYHNGFIELLKSIWNKNYKLSNIINIIK